MVKARFQPPALPKARVDSVSRAMIHWRMLASGVTSDVPMMFSRAKVAQSVEHSTENAGVGGSIPPLDTTTLSCVSEPGACGPALVVFAS